MRTQSCGWMLAGLLLASPCLAQKPAHEPTMLPAAGLCGTGPKPYPKELRHRIRLVYEFSGQFKHDDPEQVAIVHALVRGRMSLGPVLTDRGNLLIVHSYNDLSTRAQFNDEVTRVCALQKGGLLSIERYGFSPSPAIDPAERARARALAREAARSSVAIARDAREMERRRAREARYQANEEKRAAEWKRKVALEERRRLPRISEVLRLFREQWDELQYDFDSNMQFVALEQLRCSRRHGFRFSCRIGVILSDGSGEHYLEDILDISRDEAGALHVILPDIVVT